MDIEGSAVRSDIRPLSSSLLPPWMQAEVSAREMATWERDQREQAEREMVESERLAELEATIREDEVGNAGGG